MNIERNSAKKQRVVLDTNVFISAAIAPGGSPDQILKMALLHQEYTMVVSPALLQELVLVSKRHNFHPNAMSRQELLQRVRNKAEMVIPQEQLHIIQDDPSDNRVLEAALAGKANYIVTGDKKHLLPLKEFRGIKIISPRDFLVELLEKYLNSTK